MSRREQTGNRYELITCSLQGHVLVGTDAETVTDDDAFAVRLGSGGRWYRCLRCDVWVPGEHPASPTREKVPTRDEIEVPARGPVLRDKYVLRLIALDRATHVVVLGTLAILLFVFGRHHVVLQRDYTHIMDDLSGGDPGTIQVRGILAHLKFVFAYSPSHIYELGIVVTAYAALEATEMVGLWFAKRWAEYLTFIATLVFVPLEVYDLIERVTVFRVLTFVINVAIVLYLLLAKRLFGLRGGHKAEDERRRTMSGWGAVDRVTPAAGSPG